ncbi:hypothetical protein DNTS_027452 [Danionella cerebrum]|uniref:Uncharacterized protein n=1 Tax=Danionella cerebrum TaxID=2873325 RepID=A0A553Q4D9_9TELE|nr:hypothetical protein DNTS_027452 [Danionella translucida]
MEKEQMRVEDVKASAESCPHSSVSLAPLLFSQFVSSLGSSPLIFPLSDFQVASERKHKVTQAQWWEDVTAGPQPPTPHNTL